MIAFETLTGTSKYTVPFRHWSKTYCGTPSFLNKLWHHLSPHPFEFFHFPMSISFAEKEQTREGVEFDTVLAQELNEGNLTNVLICHRIMHSGGVHCHGTSSNEFMWYSCECQYPPISTSFIVIQVHFLGTFQELHKISQVAISLS